MEGSFKPFSEKNRKIPPPITDIPGCRMGKKCYIIICTDLSYYTSRHPAVLQSKKKGDAVSEKFGKDSSKMAQYVRFKDAAGTVCFGRVEGEEVQLLDGCIFADTLRETGKTVRLASINTYLTPVPIPNVLAIGANYVDHCRECDAEPPTNPLVFIKTTNALAAHGDAIQLPRLYPNAVDYEAELAVIIGKTASYVSEEDAMDYVLGFSCANDVSARDVQLKIDSQWARGKSFDTFAPVGPFLVTGITNPEELHVKMFLNGKLMQDQPVSDMIFSIRRIISHLSNGITLMPGTVILTGTPSGVGMAQEPPRYLRPGDVTEVVIDEIGTLRNTVKA